MSRAFEEVASEELDALYQGALFLSGGDPGGAEQLLVDAMTLAFKEHTQESDPGSVERWLEARLVRTLLRQVTDDPKPRPHASVPRVALDSGTFDGVGPQALFEAAAAVPTWARAALWLVVLRRWSYQDAATVMGVDRDSIPGLLGYRDVLIKEMIASKRTRPPQLEIGS